MKKARKLLHSKYLRDIETEYAFIDIDTLIADFKADMEENP